MQNHVPSDGILLCSWRYLETKHCLVFNFLSVLHTFYSFLLLVISSCSSSASFMK